MVFYKSFTAPPYNEPEILRYAGCREESGDIRKLLDECRQELDGKLSFKVCWMPLTVKTAGEVCDFGVLRVSSKALARNLDGCTEAVLFAATVGVGIERLTAKYGTRSPAKALLFDAIGTERIESLCDAFCAELERERELPLKPRFSPGYGDLPLAVQKDIFSLLDCQKRIGLTVTDSLMMSPSKSVTAIAGFASLPCKTARPKCAACGKTDCAFRSSL